MAKGRSRKSRGSDKQSGGAKNAPKPAPSFSENPALKKTASALFDRRLLIGVCVLAAFLFRVWTAHFYAKGPDNFQYLSLAREIASGEYFSADYDLSAGLAQSRELVPLYPAMIAVPIRLGADPELAGCWISIVMAALTVIPLFLAGEKLGGRWTGLGACAFFIVMPLDIIYSAHILTEDTFTFFTVLCVWLAIRAAESPSIGRAAALGLACALSYLTRDVGFGYVLLAAGSIFISGAVMKVPRKRSAVMAAAALAVFSAASLPFWVFVRVHTGKWRPTLRVAPGLTADIMGYEKGHGPRSAPAEDDEDKGDTAGPSKEGDWSGVRFNPARALVKTVRLSSDYFAHSLSWTPFPFLLFLIAGFFIVPAGGPERWAREAVPWIWFLGLALVYAFITPYMVDARYYLPAMVVSSLWAGRAAGLIPTLPGRFRSGGRGGYAALGLAVLVLAGCGAYVSRSYTRDKETRLFYRNFKAKTVSGHREIAEDAMRVLKIEPGARILARKPFFAYYLSGEHVEIGETPEDVARQVQEGACDYVIIDSMSVRKYRPKLLPLVAGLDPIPGAGLVYRRYLRAYNKLFSIYKVGSPGLSLKVEVNKQNEATVLREAIKLFDLGYVEHARQMLLPVEAIEPNSTTVHWELMKVYMVYGAFDGVSLDKADDELIKYSFLNGDDPAIGQYKATLEKLRTMREATWGPRPAGR